MFTIVQFKGTNEVEGVPSTWFIKEDPSGIKCHFPSCQGSVLETLILQNDMPIKSWKKYGVKIICTSLSYDKLVVKRNHARSESEISDSEVETQNKKSKRLPTVESDEDLGTEENLSPHPSPPSGFASFSELLYARLLIIQFIIMYDNFYSF